MSHCFPPTSPLQGGEFNPTKFCHIDLSWQEKYYREYFIVLKKNGSKRTTTEYKEPEITYVETDMAPV